MRIELTVLSPNEIEYMKIIAEDYKIPVGHIKAAYHDMLKANFEQDINDVAEQLKEEM